MPDYDIEVTALAAPPVAAPVAAYRPAVSVRNNGIHPAAVTGTMRCYRREPPGELLATFGVSLANLAAGATGTAQAATFWTPVTADIGREFLFTADVSTDNDQVEPNNHLGPTTVLIIPGEEPTPPAVTPHAPQHEDGGSDPIDITGLTGQAADPQIPTDHESTHRAGAPDELNVANLHGVLYDDQRAQDHGNERHDPDMASSAELDAHALGTTAHADATNLANREVSGDEEGLVKGEQLAATSEPVGDPPEHLFLSNDRVWRHTPAGSGGSSLGINAEVVEAEPLVNTTLAELEVPSAWNTDDMQFILKLCGYIHTLPSSGATLDLTLFLGDEELGVLQIPFAGASDREFTIEAAILGRDPHGATGVMSWIASGLLPTDFELYQTNANALLSRMLGDTTIKITAMHNNQNEGSLMSMTGYIRALHQPA